MRDGKGMPALALEVSSPFAVLAWTVGEVVHWYSPEVKLPFLVPVQIV